MTNTRAKPRFVSRRSLDRIELPPLEEIPDSDALESEDTSEKEMRWRIPGTRITIARVEDGPQKHEYLFTSGTVGRAAEYYEDVKHLPYRTTGPDVSPGLHRWYISTPGNPTVAAIVNKLPEWTRDRWYGVTLWKWARADSCLRRRGVAHGLLLRTPAASVAAEPARITVLLPCDRVPRHGVDRAVRV